MKKTSAALSPLIALPLALAACSAPSEDVYENVSDVEQGTITSNAITSNAITSNAITSNAITSNALTSHALSTGSLSSDALMLEALEDPSARLLLKYLTSCALPAGAHFDLEIEGQTYGFDGEIGLAPEWGEPDGSCDRKCKSWVSGCILSRIDHLGEPIPISIRGEHAALATARSERIQYNDREATYYGDIFSSPQRLYACLAPGKTTLQRVCGSDLDSCDVEVVGECEELCGEPRFDGSFPRCQADEENCINPDYRHYGSAYLGSVTVFLD